MKEYNGLLAFAYAKRAQVRSRTVGVISLQLRLMRMANQLEILMQLNRGNEGEREEE